MLGGSIVAGVGWLVVVLILAALRLTPAATHDLPGSGWPWRIDGAWSFAADLGPLLAVGAAFAATTTFYLYQGTGVRSRRWPLALIAASVGWFAAPRHGLVAISGGTAFVVVVIAAHHWSTAARRPINWTRPLVAVATVAVLGLAAVSLSYSALHPLAAFSTEPAGLALRNGRSPMFMLDLENGGPLDTRVEAIALPVTGRPPDQLRLAGVEIDSGLREAPTLAGLYRPFQPLTLAPRQHAPVYLTLAATGCAQWRVTRVDVRIHTAGQDRTQRVPFAPALTVSC